MRSLAASRLACPTHMVCHATWGRGQNTANPSWHRSRHGLKQCAALAALHCACRPRTSFSAPCTWGRSAGRLRPTTAYARRESWRRRGAGMLRRRAWRRCGTWALALEELHFASSLLMLGRLQGRMNVGTFRIIPTNSKCIPAHVMPPTYYRTQRAGPLGVEAAHVYTRPPATLCVQASAILDYLGSHVLLLTRLNLRDYLGLKVELEGTSGEGSALVSARPTALEPARQPASHRAGALPTGWLRQRGYAWITEPALPALLNAAPGLLGFGMACRSKPSVGLSAPCSARWHRRLWGRPARQGRAAAAGERAPKKHKRRCKRPCWRFMRRRTSTQVHGGAEAGNLCNLHWSAMQRPLHTAAPCSCCKVLLPCRKLL